MQRSWLAASLLCALSIARAQTVPLQQQLQELKDQYAATTRALEQRIAALEQQIEKERAVAAAPKGGTVSADELLREAAETAVRARSEQVGANFQGALPSAPTYDLLREADRKIE